MSRRCFFIIVFNIILPGFNLYAQDVLWAKATTNVAFLEGVIPLKTEADNSGNVYVLYTLMNRSIFDGILMTSNGYSDILLVKYDTDGNILWKNQMGGLDWDQGADLAMDKTGNVLLTGIMPNGGSFLGQTLDINNGGAFVAKIHPSGTLIWVRQYGDINGQGQVICADKNNNVIVTGKNNLDNLVVIKYDAAGTILWSKPIQYLTCCVPPRADDVAVDSQNNIVLSGSFVGHISFSGVTIEAPVFYSAYIFKMTENGNYVWSNQIDGGDPQGGLGDSYARGWNIAIDFDDNIFIVGHFRTSATFDTIFLSESNPISDRTGFIAKLTPAGVFSWANPIFGVDIMATGVKINPNTNELNIVGGGLLGHNDLIGYQYDDQYISPDPVNQSFVIITNLSGEFKRSINLLANGAYISDIAYDNNNNLFAAGNYNADLPLGCFTLTNGDFYTGFLFKTGKLPDIKVTGLTQVCLNQDILFKAEGEVTGATKFVWSFPPGFVSSTGSFVTTGNTILVTTGGVKDAFVSVLPYYACYPLVEYGTTFTMLDVPTKPSIPIGDLTVCPESVHLYRVTQVPTATSYTWQMSGLLAPDSSQPLIDSAFRVDVLASFTTGSIRVFANNSCGQSEPSEPLSIVHNVPTIPTIIGGNEFCADEITTFKTTSTDAISFGWQFSIQPDFTSASKDSSEIHIKLPRDHSQITVSSVAKGVCDVIFSSPLNIRILQPVFTGDILGTPLVCKGEEVHYEIPALSNELQAIWTAPPGFSTTRDSGNEVDYTVTSNAISGELKVEVSNRCFTNHNTILIVVNSIPEIPAIIVGKCESTIEYQGHDIFEWYQNNNHLSEQGRLLTVADSGFYKIQTHNLCGVRESEVVKLSPVVYSDLWVPNVITPDNNGKNDYFIIDSRIKTPSLKIMNRWGEVIYKDEQYNNNWGGESLASGMYYYTIQNECLPSPIKGWLHIISND